ncbi:MAG: alpha/beta hydrolase fold domain-containing protein [Bacteroidales bacterium]|jgi:acetyl esterase/lipase|nr:alpha/beta hydrolase fold domain-containing protein [Bacteroidales bacterium]
MKKTSFILVAVINCIAFTARAEDVTAYHFQEGFAVSTPAGWTRNCGNTSSMVHTGETFEGAYAPKFDKTNNGESKNLMSPAVLGAGKLTFWLYTNSGTNQLSVHVCTLINGVSEEIKLIPYSQITKAWTKFEVNIHAPATTSLKINFWAELLNDAEATVAIDDIELTKYAGGTEPEPDPEGEVVERINTDFSDGTWGVPVDVNPASGAYPSSEVNGFKLINAVLRSGSIVCSGGGKHTNRILLDKVSNGGALEFPALKDVGEVEIHANTGTADMSFRLEEWVSGSWQQIGVYNTLKTDSIYTIALMRNTETRLRIANNTGSGLYVNQIITRSLREAGELIVVSAVTSKYEYCYYNLTKAITLNFNKEVEAGAGGITLNGADIALGSCTINGKIVSVPVTLEGTTSGKSYSLIIAEGAFVEKGNTTNLSKEKTVTFSTYKTVSYPSGYAAIIDAHYSTDDLEQQRMDIYYPTNPTSPVPVVINIHGGGWNHGEKESQTGHTIYFDMGMAVANLEYRMTGQATAPAAVEDVRCAMKYLIKNAAQLNIDPNKIILQGGSAGAHLALTGAYLGYDTRYDNGCSEYNNFKVIAVIDKYGPAHLQEFMHYGSLVNWLGSYKDDPDFVLSISPYHLVNADTPPTYVVHGDADPTVEYEQSQLLVQALSTAGVKHQFTTIPGGGHGGFSSEYNTQINNEIVAFLNEILNNLPSSVSPVSVENNIQIKQINNVLLISSLNDSTTFVYDTCGRKIISSDKKEIVLNESGVFIVKVISGEQVFADKIIR